MRSLLLLFASLFFLSSCENSENLTRNEENDLIQKINYSAQKFQNDSSIYATYGSKKIDKNKAIKLAIADAIGGAISTGAGPYGVLWGGFFASLTVEPYIRKQASSTNSVNSANEEIRIPIDNNENFIYGHLGENHNILMKTAIDNNIKAEVTDNRISSELKSYILSYNFYSEDILSAFTNCEDNLVNIINKANENGEVDDFDHEGFLNSFPLSSFQKEVINAINDNLFTINDSNITSYLLSVQDAINNDSNISSGDKESLLVYVAILNSSAMLWLDN